MVIRLSTGKKSILIYAFLMAVLLLLLKWLEWRFLIMRHAFEIYAGIIAIIFTGLGIWLALKLSRPKTETLILEKEIYIGTSTEIDEKAIAKYELSKRELEVLELMAKGLSNQEIAEALFVSLNTIKTHSSNIFAKLDAKRRTQAVEKAKQLKIIG